MILILENMFILKEKLNKIDQSLLLPVLVINAVVFSFSL